MIYTHTCWMVMGLNLLVINFLIASTIGTKNGSGTFLLICSIPYLLHAARTNEKTARAQFLSNRNIARQADMIVQFSEALRRQGKDTEANRIKNNEFPIGMGSGSNTADSPTAGFTAA